MNGVWLVVDIKYLHSSCPFLPTSLPCPTLPTPDPRHGRGAETEAVQRDPAHRIHEGNGRVGGGGAAAGGKLRGPERGGQLSHQGDRAGTGNQQAWCCPLPNVSMNNLLTKTDLTEYNTCVVTQKPKYSF